MSRSKMRGPLLLGVALLYLELGVSVALGTTDGLKLHASDASEGQQFGQDIAISGNYAVVGSVDVAYVFRREGSGWIEEAKLVPNVDKPTKKPVWVAIDGSFCIVGVPGDDHSGENSGAAYVYVRDGTAWRKSARLVGADVKAGAGFGAAVAISNKRCIIGATGDSTNGTKAGAAYIFQYDGQVWSEVAKLTPANVGPYTRIGQSVAINGEYCLVIGRETQTAKDPQGEKPATAYVFHRIDNNWVEHAQLQPSGVQPWVYGYHPVAISNDCVVVGGYLTDRGAAVCVFRRDGDNWRQEALLAGRKRHGHGFGAASVALSGDFLIVGAPLAASGSAVYVYRHNGTDWQRWTLLTIDDEPTNGMFGRAVATDGQYCIVGSPQDHDLDASAGAAYVWPTSWRDIPPPLTEKQISAMTQEQVQQALGWIARARAYYDYDDVLEQRLISEFRLLWDRFKQLRDEKSIGSTGS